MSQVKEVINLGAKLQVSEDQGLYRLAFHPMFGQTGHPQANSVYVTYSHRPSHPQAGPDASLWRLSRFTWIPSTGTIDTNSETILIQQFDPHRWHNGGTLEFDNDGYLLVACGDGGGADNQFGLSQTVTKGFFGGVLRIDVDNNPARSGPIIRQPASYTRPANFPQSYSQGYGIPKDNPWTDTTGANLGEFYAIGLRSPHGAHYDRVLGELWVGDVGQFGREELNRIQRGGNYQWPGKEGDIVGPGSTSTLGSSISPLYAYGRSQGSCIIGGMRYRGSKWASLLAGKVLFADNGTGRLHAYDPNPSPGSPNVAELTSIPGSLYTGISNIFTDSAGEIYLLKLNGDGVNGGTIRKLIHINIPLEPPALLSQTGLFTDTAALVPANSLTAYDVASSLWSDGAEKKRWMAIPNDGIRNTENEFIRYSNTENWEFPAGSIFVKHFEMPLDERNPSIVKRLETRVIVCLPGKSKYGITYRWNAEGTDATLLTTSEDEVFPVTNLSGSVTNRRWTYPSRNDCMQCHTNASGQAIGIRTHQLNLMVRAPGDDILTSQLELLKADRVFGSSLPNSFPVLVSRDLADNGAPLEHRVRSYLDSNCAHCHRPDSDVPFFDARLHTPLSRQGLVNALIQGQYHLPGGRYIKPGAPQLSAIHTRNASTDAGIAMPPLGRHLIDHEASALISEYIQSLDPGDFPGTPTPPVRVTLAASAPAIGKTFPVTIVFDSNVTDFTSGDLVVDGGTVTGLKGNGYYYVATIVADQPAITVSIPSGKAGGMAGNLPSNTLEIQSEMETPPVPSLSGVPLQTMAGFEVRLSFDKAYTGFTRNDLLITNGTVEFLEQDGDGWKFVIVPTSSPVSLNLRAGAVTGSTGLPSTEALLLSGIPIVYPTLTREAENMRVSTTGFLFVADPTASGSAYMWVPKETNDPNWNVSILQGTFTPPTPGVYRLRAWTRADDTDSNSLLVSHRPPSGLQGPYLMSDTNQGVGEIGSGRFHPGLARESGGSPHLFNLAAGSSTFTIRVAERGTRIDKVALIPERPIAIARWQTAPSSATERQLLMTFTSPVTGLSIEDFELRGCSIKSLSVEEESCVVTIRMTSGKSLIRLKGNVVIDEFGASNLPSDWFFASFTDQPYTEWTAAMNLNSTPFYYLRDDDGDGLGQMMEYALGLDPRKPDAKPIDLESPYARGLPLHSIVPQGSGHRLLLTFDRRRDQTTFRYIVEFTDDFRTYSRHADFNGLAEPIDAQWERITVPDDSAAGSKISRFGRLRVEMNN